MACNVGGTQLQSPSRFWPRWCTTTIYKFDTQIKKQRPFVLKLVTSDPSPAFLLLVLRVPNQSRQIKYSHLLTEYRLSSCFLSNLKGKRCLNFKLFIVSNKLLILIAKVHVFFRSTNVFFFSERIFGPSLYIFFIVFCIFFVSNST